ncbi:metallophosphoesterase [Haloechinothrix salitolerans]|uniref:Metallophosphoesterase n=1 Tax=Haloechinothrix salitolerans TaxID=926830 RepID=A0ABW2CAK7_9PSEU
MLLPLVHVYLWRRLIHDTMPRGTGRRIATLTLVTMVVLMLAALMFATRIDPDIGQWLAWPGYLWLALFFYLLLALLVLEVPRFALRRWARGGPSDGSTSGSRAPGRSTPPTDVEPIATGPGAATAPTLDRRRVLARGSAAIAGLTAAGLVGYGTTVALGPPSVTRVPIALRKLDPRVAGCRIALISDIHLGPILGRSFTQRIVDMINAEDVDAVGIAGDLVDGSVDDLADAAAPLAGLRSTHGTFFVTGNHEYYSGYQDWVDFLPDLGITVLRNDRTEITHNGGTFDLAGINDATAYQFQDPGDVSAALAGRDPERAVVLLAHQPVDLEDAVAHDVDLMLAGHTHGGQLTPFELLVTLQQGAVAGMYQRGGTKMYVTRGAGFWGPPVRVGAPPDITIVELRAQ